MGRAGRALGGSRSRGSERRFDSIHSDAATLPAAVLRGHPRGRCESIPCFAACTGGSEHGESTRASTVARFRTFPEGSPTRLCSSAHVGAQVLHLVALERHQGEGVSVVGRAPGPLLVVFDPHQGVSNRWKAITSCSVASISGQSYRLSPQGTLPESRSGALPVARRPKVASRSTYATNFECTFSEIGAEVRLGALWLWWKGRYPAGTEEEAGRR
jgi:hypothetical protein